MHQTTPQPSASDEDTPPQSPLLVQSPPAPSQPPQTPCRYPTVKDEDEDHNEDSPILVAGLKRGRDEDNVDEPELSNPFPDPLAHMRPSDYLRGRCPLCFGSEFPTTCQESDRSNNDPNAIVCVDACFTQKHNCQSRDSPCTHPRTVFIPEADAEVMEKYIEFIRSKKVPRIKKPNTEEPDHFKGSLHVPKSVLDGCEASFTAADSRRNKESTQFFDDIALMVLLCCHDVVLFIVNMQSAGEKQHYVMVLVETLFQHLPLPYRIGLLYDIGCQTERSCIKWNFLDRYVERISFGISVFHAFGHQWACQIIYHPRKRTGFGLSDGEGCEQFWHSISRLIAYLGVCGVDHAQRETLENLGAWPLCQSRHALTKQKAAESILQECGKSKTDLQAEWEAQVKTQTKPLPHNCIVIDNVVGQSQSAGKDAVKELLQLRETRDGLRKREREYDALIEDEVTPVDEYMEAKVDLELVHVHLQELNTRIQDKQSVMGVNDRARLKNLTNNPFLTAQMNALALKQRLHDRLCARKFEMERLECLFCKQVNDYKVDAHTASSIKQREPAITKVAHSFNALCDTMEDLLKKGKAPYGVTCAKKLEIKGIFALDVDDAIWQDLGLDKGSLAVPLPWLSDKGVSAGIRAVLEYDRCIKEKLSVNSLDFGSLASLPDWGPSAEEIINFRISQKTAVFKEALTVNTESRDTERNIKLEHREQDKESKYSDSEHGEADIILFDILDSADASWTGADDKYLYDD
ncbi:hypothetical protein DXG01_003939 [Tephrocybe rancida]|nr:hypothetical protein DXG01_003939 [Tephrocybe rancida]